jgi:hypothetical protein
MLIKRTQEPFCANGPRLALLGVVAVLMATAGCSSSSNNPMNPPSGRTEANFASTGQFSTGGQIGRLFISIDSLSRATNNASGLLQLGNDQLVTLSTGDYNTETRAVRVTNGSLPTPTTSDGSGVPALGGATYVYLGDVGVAGDTITGTFSAGAAGQPVSLAVSTASGPIQDLLGNVWSYTAVATFGGMSCPDKTSDKKGNCVGHLRPRLGENVFVVDASEECTLPLPADTQPRCEDPYWTLDNENWNGNTHSQPFSFAFLAGACNMRADGTLMLTFTDPNLTAQLTDIKVVVTSGEGCEGLVDSCSFNLDFTATHCTNCWPSTCNS